MCPMNVDLKAEGLTKDNKFSQALDPELVRPDLNLGFHAYKSCSNSLGLNPLLGLDNFFLKFPDARSYDNNGNNASSGI